MTAGNGASKFHTLIGEDAYRNLLMDLVTPNTNWLDLGCGWRLLREWLPRGEADQLELSRRARCIVGIDAVAADVEQNPYVHTKVVGDLFNLPFEDCTFELATAQMVVEHLEHPVPFLREVRRVLKPGGVFVFLTPNYLNYQVLTAALIPDVLKKRIIWYLEQREETDVFKTYYRMNTERRVRATAKESGMIVHDIRMMHQAWELARIPPLHAIERVLFRVLDCEAFSGYRPEILGTLARA